MSDTSRDERLIALEAEMMSAKSKLKSAETAAEEIGQKLQSNEDAFTLLISRWSERYKSQNGTELVRSVDETTGKVTYDFVREATEKEQKKRRKIVISREFDGDSGKYRYKFKPQDDVENDDDNTVTVTTAKDLKKPKDRKKFIAVKILGHYGKIELSSAVDNPFLNTIGRPVIVPVQAAAKLTEKIGNAAANFAGSSVGKGVSKAAKIVSSPVVIPAKVVKDIADKGGVIHAVVDLGDKIRIEGNIPKPLKVSANIVKGAALGIETGAAETAKGVKNFSLEIAKEKISEEINKSVSENEASQAAYVIGVKIADIYKILDEHSRYKKAVRRDIAGDDIVDVDVSKYLIEKEEKLFQKGQDKLKEQKAAADYNAHSARAEYEAAKKRLESYRKNSCGETRTDTAENETANQEKSEDTETLSPSGNDKQSAKGGSAEKAANTPQSEAQPEVITDNKTEKNNVETGTDTETLSPSGSDKHSAKGNPAEKVKNIPQSEVKLEVLTDTDKKIEKTKRKLTLNKKHRYKLKFKRRAVRGIISGQAKMKRRPMLVREEKPDYTPATAWNTAKKLDGYAVGTGIKSMRKKAMRDGGDNTAVEAADFAVSTVQRANRAVKYIDGKERAYKEKLLKEELVKLENQKKLESTLREIPNQKAVPKNEGKKKSSKKRNKANQNKLLQKKRQQKLVQSNLAEKSKKAARDLVRDIAGYALKRGRSIVILIIMIPLISPVIGLFSTIFSGGATSIISTTVSPCETNDLSLCEEYYTELSKNLIEQHRNIKDHYTGYDRYTCLTEIDKLDHSPQKLLPFLAVSAMGVSGDDVWDFEAAKPFAESLFEQQFELYTNEVYEVRKHVTDKSESYSSDSFSIGCSTYPVGDNVYYSSDYVGEAHTWTSITVPVASGYADNTLDCIGKYTDKNGYTNEYEKAQTITFNNYWELNLIFEMPDGADTYIEHWEYTCDCQDYSEYDYATLEYAIREKDISVDGSYWTDTDSDWQDNTFDKLIYNQYIGFTEEEQEQFDIWYEFFMGHQSFDMPFEEAEISKYAGYNTEVNGDLSLDKSFELKTYSGQEIICGMDGDITVIDTGFYIYNAKYGTIYYDGAAPPAVSKAKQGDVISSSTGDVLRITYIDNEGNYINPLLIFS